MTKSLLLVEDAENQNERYAKILRGHYTVFAVKTLEEAKTALENSVINIILTDIHLTLEGTEGFDLIKYAKEFHPNTLVISMSASPSIDVYRKTFALGSHYFLKKPIVNVNDVLIAVESAYSSKELQSSGKSVKFTPEFEDGIVIDDSIRKTAAQLAIKTKICTTIIGETGTGKEEIAKLIHKKRQALEKGKNIPFIPVNCANIPKDMVPSLFFGHRKGAFTGADKTTNGYIGDADGGILFLDEIHVLPLACQRTLLRVLNDGKYERLGDTKTLSSTFQLIVATGVDLDIMVDKGEFLLDLRTRLLGAEINLLPLRERLNDIATLIKLFFLKEDIKISTQVISDLTEKCKKYYWQGNIRQLFKVLQSMVLQADLTGGLISDELLPEYRTMLAPGQRVQTHQEKFFTDDPDIESALNKILGVVLEENVSFKDLMDSIEKSMLSYFLKHYQSIARTADKIGTHRNTLKSKLKKYNINSHSS